MVKEISLTQGKVTLVDDEDFEDLNRFKWKTHSSGRTTILYAARYDENRSYVFMHRKITNCPNNRVVDHINGDGLDNRKENLRIVTHRSNLQNGHSSKSSRFPGISWYKQQRRWVARILYNGKNQFLGSSTNELEAATMYQVACAVLIKED